MSSYYDVAIHPVTGKMERAAWIDDAYGKHVYGVKFDDGSMHRTDAVTRVASTDLLEQTIELKAERDRLKAEVAVLTEAKKQLEEEREGLREALDNLISNAKVLQQNSMICAGRHHHHDFEADGIPGWLESTEASIQRALSALTGDKS